MLISLPTLLREDPILVLIVAIYGKTRLHKICLFANLAIGIWGVGSYFIGKTTDPSSAITVWQYAFIGVIFIPVTLYHTMPGRDGELEITSEHNQEETIFQALHPVRA